jgi:hypothetical protein
MAVYFVLCMNIVVKVEVRQPEESSGWVWYSGSTTWWMHSASFAQPVEA